MKQLNHYIQEKFIINKNSISKKSWYDFIEVESNGYFNFIQLMQIISKLSDQYNCDDIQIKYIKPNGEDQTYSFLEALNSTLDIDTIVLPTPMHKKYLLLELFPTNSSYIEKNGISILKQIYKKYFSKGVYTYFKFITKSSLSRIKQFDIIGTKFINIYYSSHKNIIKIYLDNTNK